MDEARRQARRTPCRWLVAVVAIATVATGCVTDRSAAPAGPPVTGVGGPACQASAEVADTLTTDEAVVPDPVEVGAALRRMGPAVPEELQGFVRVLLSDPRESDLDGAPTVEDAWLQLDRWSVAMCEAPLIPSAWLNTSPFDGDDGQGWAPAGASDATTTTTADVAESVEPPPSFQAVQMLVAVAHEGDDAGADAWWGDGDLSGIVSSGREGIAVQVFGADGSAQALQVCTDTAAVLASDRPVDVAVRGANDQLLAFTGDLDGCRISNGA